MSMCYCYIEGFGFRNLDGVETANAFTATQLGKMINYADETIKALWLCPSACKPCGEF